MMSTSSIISQTNKMSIWIWIDIKSNEFDFLARKCRPLLMRFALIWHFKKKKSKEIKRRRFDWWPGVCVSGLVLLLLLLFIFEISNTWNAVSFSRASKVSSRFVYLWRIQLWPINHTFTQSIGLRSIRILNENKANIKSIDHAFFGIVTRRSVCILMRMTFDNNNIFDFIQMHTIIVRQCDACRLDSHCRAKHSVEPFATYDKVQPHIDWVKWFAGQS